MSTNQWPPRRWASLHGRIGAPARLGAALVALALVFAAARPAAATILYGTALDIGGLGALVKIDTSANSVTTLFTTSDAIDSLILNNPANPAAIYFTDLTNGTIHRFDLGTSTDNSLIGVPGGSGAQPADIAADPSGLSLLVSEFVGSGTASGGAIDRITLNPSVSAAVLKTGLTTSGPEGLAYVTSGAASGELFANLGARGDSATHGLKDVVQIDPASGATIQTFTNGGAHFDSLDSLVFDPHTGLLWATSHFGQELYSIDPVTGVAVPYGISGIAPLAGAGNDVLDGLTTDGAGHLFVSEQNWGDLSQNRVDIFDVDTDTWSISTTVARLDDLAPVIGQPINDVPEPISASLSILGLGSLALATRRRRRA